MDRLLIAVEVAWQALWAQRLTDLRHDILVTKEGLRVSSNYDSDLHRYWVRHLQSIEEELALLTNVSEAIDKARRA